MSRWEQMKLIGSMLLIGMSLCLITLSSLSDRAVVLHVAAIVVNGITITDVLLRWMGIRFAFLGASE